MNRVFNLGSINIDHVYRMPRLATPGETLISLGYEKFAGGKGFNQSVALARAGAKVSHIGFLGEDGIWLQEYLVAEGIDCADIQVVTQPTGHAVIQVLPSGENSIFLHPGANQTAAEDYLRKALAKARPGDFFLCQNETGSVKEFLREGRRLGLKTIFNAAPAPTSGNMDFLNDLDLLIVNESEACAVGGLPSPEAAMESLRREFPRLDIVLTLGSRGALWSGPETRETVAAMPVDPVDTTAAGDTFTGYLLAALLRGSRPLDALAMANRAASITVSRAGAADSIPTASEVF
jgi:ribokinase